MKDVDALCRLCSDVLLPGDERLQRYSHDQIDERQYWQVPSAVLFPKSTEEVATIVGYAAGHSIALTARGGGSGLAGAAIPAVGGVVLSFEKMNRILDIDVVNSVAVVEPGVITGDLDRALQPYGLFFPAYPISNSISCIGGNVACNAGGSRAIKYGVTSQHVLAAECVFANGSVLKLGGPYLKRASGYNLLPLLVGSEGTLAIFTRLTLRLQPRPLERRAAMFKFSDFTIALRSMVKIRNSITPSALEYMDSRSVIIADPSYKELLNEDDILLLVEIDGAPGQAWERLRSIVSDAGASILQEAKTEEELKELWSLREHIPWALKRHCGEFHEVEDTVVPLATLPEYIKELRKLSRHYGLEMAVFGHAGDGNVHIIPIKPEALPADEWAPFLCSLQRELYRIVSELGGCISGEHGIGIKRKNFLAEIIDERELGYFRQIKQIFDPQNILNPGKVIDVEGA